MRSETPTISTPAAHRFRLEGQPGQDHVATVGASPQSGPVGAQARPRYPGVTAARSLTESRRLVVSSRAA